LDIFRLVFDPRFLSTIVIRIDASDAIRLTKDLKRFDPALLSAPNLRELRRAIVSRKVMVDPFAASRGWTSSLSGLPDSFVQNGDVYVERANGRAFRRPGRNRASVGQPHLETPSPAGWCASGAAHYSGWLAGALRQHAS
jgi:hypothetical protein